MEYVLMSLIDIYKNKVVVVTGHTGFKGSWFSLWLKQLGAHVIGISVDIPTTPSHFDSICLESCVDDYRFDVRDGDQLRKVLSHIQPDFIFHLAAQALVRTSYDSPLDTISINAHGTANILDAIRYINTPVVAVMITSDKVYDNVEWVWGYRETDQIGGKDPYSASKGMAELVIKTYVESFFRSSNTKARVGIARAGNVIGGGDWAVDRIVPDCMRAWSSNQVVDIRNPLSTRPWQHVLEPLSGYLVLGATLARDRTFHGEAFNYGPPAGQNYSVSVLIDEMSKYWGNVRWNDISNSEQHLHEAGLLKLNCDKALSKLEWVPTLQFDDTVRMTINWYKQYYECGSRSMHDFSLSQICEYTDIAIHRKSSWAID